MLVEEARELLFLAVFFHCCGDYLFGLFPFDMLPFKRKLLRIWQCLWLIVIWQWYSSEMGASRKITIQTWQKLADIFVRVKHRAQRQIYHKNQYHELLGCQCLFIMATRATLSPELLPWSSAGTWHYPKGEILQATIHDRSCCWQDPLASFGEDARHLLLPKGTKSWAFSSCTLDWFS